MAPLSSVHAHLHPYTARAEMASCQRHAVCKGTLGRGKGMAYWHHASSSKHWRSISSISRALQGWHHACPPGPRKGLGMGRARVWAWAEQGSGPRKGLGMGRARVWAAHGSGHGHDAICCSLPLPLSGGVSSDSPSDAAAALSRINIMELKDWLTQHAAGKVVWEMQARKPAA